MTGHTDHTRQAAIEAAAGALGYTQAGRNVGVEERRAAVAAFVDVVLGVVPPPPAAHPDCVSAGRCTRLAPPATPRWDNEPHPPAPHQNGR